MAGTPKHPARTPTAEELAADIKAYLAAGNEIEVIPRGVTAEGANDRAKAAASGRKSGWRLRTDENFARSGKTPRVRTNR